jgi:hypothetical protein
MSRKGGATTSESQPIYKVYLGPSCPVSVHVDVDVCQKEGCLAKEGKVGLYQL